MGSGDVTSAPYTAQASGGGLVTIPQGSTIADIAPTLTNFQQQPDQRWANLLKGLVGQTIGAGVPTGAGGGVPTGAGGGVPAAVPISMPRPGVALGGQAPPIPTMLGQIDPVALKTAAMILKTRLMGF